MIMQNQDEFDEATVDDRRSYMENQQQYTDEVLKPFRDLALLEDNGEGQSPWAVEGESM